MICEQRRRAIEALEARAPRQYCIYIATVVNNLQNGVNSITLCIILNAKTGKIVLVAHYAFRLNGCFVMS